LLPQAWEERRDRGLALAELGQLDAAAVDIEAYLERCSDAADAAVLRERLAVLRGGDAPGWRT
jgi:regulator of sirC expression with transglutaminase-like and TPR domain